MTDPTDDESSRAPDALDTVVQAALATFPTFGGALAVMAAHERARFDDRLARTANEAARLTTTAALEAAQLDERRCTLIVRAIVASGASAFEAKRRALAQAIAGVANAQDDALDDSELLVAALLELEVPHARALARFVDMADYNSSVRMMTGTVPGSAFSHPAVLATLERVGAIENVVQQRRQLALGELSLTVTPFGVELRQLIGNAP